VITLTVRALRLEDSGASSSVDRLVAIRHASDDTQIRRSAGTPKHPR
jgi:hypothetical protein